MLTRRTASTWRILWEKTDFVAKGNTGKHTGSRALPGTENISIRSTVPWAVRIFYCAVFRTAQGTVLRFWDRH